MENEVPAVPAPLTPKFWSDDAKQPEPEARPEAPTQTVCARQPEQEQRKPKSVPRHTRKLGRKRKPVDPQFRRDQKLLDAQLRVGTLRTFIQQHDLWSVFLQQTAWW
jgi:hypothetical protein